MNSVDLSGLESAVGYRFRDGKLLLEALTHPSHAGGKNNERLEFLGDAVLSLAVSLHLYRDHPAATEGELTKRRSAMVCSRSLMEAARTIGLGQYILLGRGEERTGGREKQSVLENAMEALLGAAFLDGGLEAALRMTGELILNAGHGTVRAGQAGKTVVGGDYKSFLQETVQAGGNEKISYETYRTEGPPHDAVFHVRLSIGEKQASSGKGKSKKEAEQEAARSALEKLYKIKF